MKKLLVGLIALISVAIAHAITLTFSCGITVDISPEVIQHYIDNGKLDWYLMGMDEAVCDQEEEDKNDDSDPLP